MTSRSPSGRRSASIARSSVWSRLHASARSIRSCTVCLLGEERVEVGVGLGERRGDRSEAVEEVAELADAVLDVPADVLRRVELGLLREEPDRRLRVELGDARRRLLEPGHDPEQRRLAGAVRAEHADFRAVQERQRDVRQDLALGAVVLVGPVHRVDHVRAHRSTQASGALARARAPGDVRGLALPSARDGRCLLQSDTCSASARSTARSRS